MRRPFSLFDEIERLLEGHFRASSFEFLFDVFSFGFRCAVFNVLRCAFNQVFSFFEAQTSDFANDFDDVDFVVASRFKNDVESIFLFSSSWTSSAGSSNWSSSGNAPFFFEQFSQISSFDNSQSREIVKEFLKIISHF